jgi:hypothetical protein
LEEVCAKVASPPRTTRLRTNKRLGFIEISLTFAELQGQV